MDRFEIAAELKEIGLLLRLKGKDQFRSQAYSRAAQAVAGVDGDFASLVREKRLTEIKGIGESLARVIEDLYRTGHSSLLEELRGELPPGASELSQIRGLTMKRIQALNQALRISSVADLKDALEAGKLRNVPGFSAETEDALREQIAQHENRGDRILLVDALKIGQRVIDYMRGFDDLVSIDLAGSIRRWKETVSRIRVTAAVSKAPARALKHFLEFPSIGEVETRKNNTAIVKLIDGVRVSFSAARSVEHWSVLHHETGSGAQ